MLLRRHFLSLLLGSYARSSASRRALNEVYRYPEMVDLHVENLASALLSSNPQEVRERLNEKLRSFANGDIPHAANAVSTLFGVLARYSASEPSSETDNPKIQTTSKCTWAAGGNRESPPHRKSMNTALLKSMHRGSFFDMEYCVRKKQIGANKYCSIYLSSTAFHGDRSKLDARTSRSSYPLCINRPLVVVHISNDRVGEGEQEADDNSDYEEEPISGPTEAGTDGSAPEGSTQCLNSLPGAFTT